MGCWWDRLRGNERWDALWADNERWDDLSQDERRELIGSMDDMAADAHVQEVERLDVIVGTGAGAVHDELVDEIDRHVMDDLLDLVDFQGFG